MQYWKPDGQWFVGDCMPFSHDGVFHIFYLLDEAHHQGRGGLGGHVWAHVSTRDLVRWEHHPIAVPLDADWEGSICTGSVFHHAGTYHAYYATRKRDKTQHLSHAVSEDGIAFRKVQPNPFASAPSGYSRFDFRDPFVFADGSGRFQMLVTSQTENYALADRGGCLLRLSSADLFDWKVESPFLVPGGDPGYACIPECPDWFCWNGWYYLLFGQGLATRYRMSRRPFGPWMRAPVDTLDNSMCAVMKTAPFGERRRIGVAWVGPRKDGKDSGWMQWGGNMILREIVQEEDGSLGTRFLDEAIPRTADALPIGFEPLTRGASESAGRVEIRAPETLEAAAASGVPAACRIRCRVTPAQGTARFGLGLRGSGSFRNHYELAFHPYLRRVTLGGAAIECVDGLDRPFDLDVFLKDDIMDACVGRRRCIINRLPELTGDRLFLFCHNGGVAFEGIEVSPLA